MAVQLPNLGIAKLLKHLCMFDRRVFISTISPVNGGVPIMTQFVTETLQRAGRIPVLAHYEPYSVSPELSVPALNLLQRRPGTREGMTWEKLETHAFGAWLPELEFTHYHATKLWEKAMDSCSRFAAVSGNALAALPFAQTKRPFTAWVATGWEEDRLDRVAKFPLYRKWLDQWINSPVLRKKEREILQAGEILALSEHTRTALDKLAGESVCDDVMPMPIDGDFFRPDIDNVCVGRVGFTGRLDDPRKNISLLIESLAGLVKVGVDATAVLVGGELDTHCAMQINLRGLSNRIRILDYVPRNELRKLLQSFDVFLLPSHQEGLCISALEAMACGCPVISTRCGGPEEFVKDHETGFLVDFDAEEMADAINRIINNRSLRQRLSEGARQLVLEQYSRERCERVFWKAFESKSVIETGTVH